MENGVTPARAEGANPATATDRRRARRHRVHTPLYASISGSAPGATNLSEVLNLGESGMCVQFSAPVRINRLLPLCLDLSETGARIYVIGHVVWSEPSGRTGIRFPDMSEASLRELRGWLEGNAKIEASRSRTLDSPALVAPREGPDSVVRAPLPGQVALANEWAEIERELESCGPDLEPALHLIAQRALTLTWSS
ncbi:MAG TPA: PilZ domain-containing protein, partial [Terracidiphilus sp.]|nr:PilZ domain-containing protein [Terracidiphilus sp.]